MNDNKKYKIINSKNLATTLFFLFGLEYYIHNHNTEPNKKVYSFEDTPELQEALATIMKIRKK